MSAFFGNDPRRQQAYVRDVLRSLGIAPGPLQEDPPEEPPVGPPRPAPAPDGHLYATYREDPEWVWLREEHMADKRANETAADVLVRRIDAADALRDIEKTYEATRQPDAA